MDRADTSGFVSGGSFLLKALVVTGVLFVDSIEACG